MRKQYRNKRAACALCKPHKRGWENRWRCRERVLYAVARRQIEIEFDPARRRPRA